MWAYRIMVIIVGCQPSDPGSIPGMPVFGRVTQLVEWCTEDAFVTRSSRVSPTISESSESANTAVCKTVLERGNWGSTSDSDQLWRG